MSHCGGKRTFTLSDNPRIIWVRFKRRKVDGVNILGLVIGASSLASGLIMLVMPRRSRLVAEADVAVRKRELAAGDREQFFEERRSLDAYQPAPTDRRWRIKGVFLRCLGWCCSRSRRCNKLGLLLGVSGRSKRVAVTLKPLQRMRHRSRSSRSHLNSATAECRDLVGNRHHLPASGMMMRL